MIVSLAVNLNMKIMVDRDVPKMGTLAAIIEEAVLERLAEVKGVTPMQVMRIEAEVDF